MSIVSPSITLALPTNVDSALALGGADMASSATNKNSRISAPLLAKEKWLGLQPLLLTGYKLTALLVVTGSAATPKRSESLWMSRVKLSLRRRVWSEALLNRAEALLTAQAHTLDGIFNYLARKAFNADYLNQYETYLRLGLKVQSQCRATLETLAAIKNPKPIAFVQQANIAHGPQQVNNERVQETPRARETEKQPNKLLEDRNDQLLDTGAQGAAGLANPALERPSENVRGGARYEAYGKAY
jgi:hypothetical protein